MNGLTRIANDFPEPGRLTSDGWIVLVYRVPTEPASKRVAVWRELKRIGALYLQQCVCVLPRREDLLDAVEAVTAKINAMDGQSTVFDVPILRPGDDDKLISAFCDLRDKEYAEIIEECETKFVKEIEFEHFRQNYTYEEAEEIRQDLDKIKRWFATIVSRDWFDAKLKEDVTRCIDRCEALLLDFEATVYRHTGDDFTSPHVDFGIRHLEARTNQEHPAHSSSGRTQKEKAG